MNSTVECPPCGGGSNEVQAYVYAIYGVLGCLLIASETLGITPSSQYNAVLQVALAALAAMSKGAARALPAVVAPRTWRCRGPRGAGGAEGPPPQDAPPLGEATVTVSVSN